MKQWSLSNNKLTSDKHHLRVTLVKKVKILYKYTKPYTQNKEIKKEIKKMEDLLCEKESR